MATAERNDEAPNSAPLGAMGSLLRRLDMLPCTYDGGRRISKLKDNIRSISDKLKKLSEVQDPPLTVNYWMKHARQLSYDIEAYLDMDELDGQKTEDSLNDSDAKKEDNPVDSDAKLEEFISDSDDEKEYSIDELQAMMADYIDESDDETKDSVDDSDGSTQDSISSSDYKISGFMIRAEGMIDRYEKFSLDSVLSCPTAATTIESPHPSRDVVLVGMGSHIANLISLLQLKDGNDNDNQLKMVSILGDEGIGKSTLIQEIWHESFKERKIWPEPQSEVNIKRAFVRMGKKPDVRMILRSILSQVSLQEQAKDSGIKNLIHDIKEHLKKKRYFIIVDDVWSESIWDVVSRAFPDCSVGSRIITTTSDKEVALACCSYVLQYNYIMKPLNVGDSEGLFIRTVVGSQTVNLQLSSDVSDEINRKCGGLPLAITWTAIPLATQPEIKEKLCQLETDQGLSKMEKEKTLNSDVKTFLAKNLRTESTPVKILNQVLKLCYNSLPHYLRTCLLYLSVYPENYFFMKEDLVKLWIAEGFICTSEKDKIEAAGRYFDVLVSLGLIQRMDIKWNKQHHQGVVVGDEAEDPLSVPYVVHPTVFDFITCKSTDDNFITVIDYSQLTISFKEKVRRLSLHFGSATYASTPESIGLSYVRTLSIMGLLSCMPSLVEFKLVRILILHLCAGDGDQKFPLAEISKLLLLKCLQIRCNVAVELPCQIACLKHLETLEINSVVTAVPSDVFHLSRLLHLRLGLKQNISPGPVTAVNAICSDELLPPKDDSSSTATPSVQICELLLTTCIFSRLPKWIAQLHKLSILEIVVRELLSTDIDVLAGLPTLTALSLYVRMPTATNIVFRRGAFPVLMYFRFMCGVLSLDFQEEAMPNLRHLVIGFNARRRDKYANILAGIQHLPNLHKVVATIGATMGTEETDRTAAESALKDAIYRHPYLAKFIEKGVHQIEEDYRPPPLDPLSINEQEIPVIHGPKTKDSRNKQKMPAKDTHRIPQFSGQHEDNSSTQQKSDLIHTSETRSISVVTGALGSLAPKLLQLLRDEYNLQKGVKRKVEWLSAELNSIYAFICKVSDVPWDRIDQQVKVWTREVREASYDMEDVLDTFLVRLEADEPADRSKLRHTMKKIGKVFSKAKSRHDLAGAIDDIKKYLEEVAERRQKYKLDESVCKHGVSTFIDPRLTAMYREVTQLIGVDKSREELVSVLNRSHLHHDVLDKKTIKKVSIVGVGGLGKTTLAKAVYGKLSSEYECRAFVSVGRDRDMATVFKDILFHLDKEKYHNIHATGRGVDLLIHELQEFLKNKRYFIVVDDVWDVERWKTIDLALIENYCGSKVITTTRKFDVAKESGEVYKLNPLSYENSKKLLYTRIFGADGQYHDNIPDEVSDRILRRCAGIPLAIITVASLLVGKPKDEWSEVYNSIGFRLNDNSELDDTMTILSFSFYDMPSHLQTCLLYLCTYPEDSYIRKDELIWKWIAEGFVHEKQGDRLFDVGERYFNDLINRSMIQAVDTLFDGNISCCRVHDIVLHLLRKFSFDENFIAILDGNAEAKSLSSNVRRFSLHSRTAEHNSSQMTKLRSYTAFGCDIDNNWVHILSFRLLRVLDLKECIFKEGCHLEHLGDLRHLRYLGIKCEGSIPMLSKEIMNLKLLQTLALHGDFPVSIVLPTKLLFLFAPRCVPNGIGKLTSLEQLTISGDPKMFVKELRNLIGLRVLCIQNTCYMDKSMQIDFVVSLSSLQKIQKIDMYSVCPIFADTDMWEAAGFVLPPRSLRHLNIFIYFSKLPSCINPSRLPNLSYLTLRVDTMDEQDMKHLASLPALSFLYLHIKSTTTASIIIAGDNDGSFQKLRYFDINAMVQIQQQNKDSWISLHIWNRVGALPFGHEKSNCSKNVPSAMMPNLEVLRFHVPLLGLKEKNDDCGNIGLEYLPSLREINVRINCSGMRTEEVDAELAALRTACNTHPNHPTLVTYTFDEEKYYTKEEQDEKQQKGASQMADINLGKLSP